VRLFFSDRTVGLGSRVSLGAERLTLEASSHFFLSYRLVVDGGSCNVFAAELDGKASSNEAFGRSAVLSDRLRGFVADITRWILGFLRVIGLW
jgi:hypothetical protein